MKATKLYEAGDKVKYKALYRDKKTWLQGTVHAVRSYEDDSGKVIKQTYLIDTGRVVPGTDKPMMLNQRDVGLQQAAHKLIHKNMPADMADDHPDYKETLTDITDKAYAKAAKGKLPKSKLVAYSNAQPEQIECLAKHVKAAG